MLEQDADIDQLAVGHLQIAKSLMCHISLSTSLLLCSFGIPQYPNIFLQMSWLKFGQALEKVWMLKLC